jgi:hypothetical protein
MVGKPVNTLEEWEWFSRDSFLKMSLMIKGEPI